MHSLTAFSWLWQSTACACPCYQWPQPCRAARPIGAATAVCGALCTIALTVRCRLCSVCCTTFWRLVMKIFHLVGGCGMWDGDSGWSRCGFTCPRRAGPALPWWWPALSPASCWRSQLWVSWETVPANVRSSSLATMMIIFYISIITIIIIVIIGMVVIQWLEAAMTVTWRLSTCRSKTNTNTQVRVLVVTT